MQWERKCKQKKRNDVFPVTITVFFIRTMSISNTCTFMKCYC